MRKFLLWGLSSCLCTGCVVQSDATQIKVVEPVCVQSENLEAKQENSLEIKGVLHEMFIQGTDNQQYVYHDVDGYPTTAGPNFMDYRCDLNSDNLILYGHSSKTSDILFTPLMNYLDVDFAKRHNELVLHYGGETMTFDLFSVFLFDVTKSSDNDWMQTQFQKEFLFEQALQRLQRRSLYDLSAPSGNQLLTLVTCNTANGNERLIVMGIRKQE